jgi:hypothetical protein
MSLQIDRLEKARTTGGGRIQARCPACAEGGGDTSGQHLIIYPDGRYGCCVHPGDKQHRRRIFALVGKARREIEPIVVVRKASASQPTRQWKAVRVAMPIPQTPPSDDSRTPVPNVPEDDIGSSLPPVGTLGTLISYPRAHTGRENITYAPCIHGGRDLLVPSVPQPSNSKDSETPVPNVPNHSPKPYIDTDGNLRIPFDSPARYHWWKGGQSIAETLREVGTSEAAFAGI